MKGSTLELPSLDNSRQPVLVACLAVMFVITGFCPNAAAQNNRVLMNNLRTLQPESLRISAYNDSSIELMNTANLQNLQLPAKRNAVVQFSRTISGMPRQQLAKVNKEVLAEISNGRTFQIPELHLEAVGSGEESSRTIAYQPVITSLRPLTYNYSLQKFTSSMSFLLLSGSGGPENISNPVMIELHSNYLETIDPRQLKISHLNLPSTDVSVTAEDVRDSVQVKIVTKNNTDGYRTFLRVEPSLTLVSNRDNLQGFGIQQIPLHLRWKGSTSQQSKKVTISTSRGTVTPNSVNLRYDRPRTVLLRSEGIGEVTITASTSNETSNELRLSYVFPWMFLLFSMLGGVAGGTAKYYRAADQPTSFTAVAIGSLAIGFLGAVAYFALGINLLGLEFSSTFNEFAVLGISALIAYFGIRKW